MYTPNHIMLSIVPPPGTQLIGTVDGSYMFIFDRSLKTQILEWFNGIIVNAETQSAVPVVTSSSGTASAPVPGKVLLLKGDATFEFAASPPTEKLDETVHVAVPDTERPPPDKTETQEVLETVFKEDVARS